MSADQIAALVGVAVVAYVVGRARPLYTARRWTRRRALIGAPRARHMVPFLILHPVRAHGCRRSQGRHPVHSTAPSTSCAPTERRCAMSTPAAARSAASTPVVVVATDETDAEYGCLVCEYATDDWRMLEDHHWTHSDAEWEQVTG